MGEVFSTIELAKRNHVAILISLIVASASAILRKSCARSYQDHVSAHLEDIDRMMCMISSAVKILG
jgi:hypothetical protein